MHKKNADLDIWAATWDFQQCNMCGQQSLRSACAYAQSDQSLCKSLEYSMNVKLLTEQHLEFLILKESCTGSFESTLVKMPHCWKSHVTAHLSFISILDGSNTALREHLIDDLDYFLLPDEGWNKLVSWYSIVQDQVIQRRNFPGLFLNSGFWGWLSIESQPQNLEFRKLSWLLNDFQLS